MSKLIASCPACSSTQLNVMKIECENCSTIFEGKFEIPLLLRLSQHDLNFILDFVKCSGSLKDLAIQQKVSYPTLRNRLNQLIEQIDNLSLRKIDPNPKIKI